MKDLFRRQWFLISLSAVLLLGFSFPNELTPIAELPVLRQAVLAIVLFLMALPLRTQLIVRTIASPWPALLASAINMGVLPLVSWATSPVLHPELAVGLIIAGCVPSTLASGVVWTRRAGGNDAAAMLVTIITNLLCFVVTPGWLFLLLGHSQQLPVAAMITKLMLLVVLPMVLAQLLRQNEVIGEWATERKSILSRMAQIGILTMVLIGAIRSGLQLQKTGGESVVPLLEMIKMLMAVVFVHLLTLFGGRAIAKALKMSPADQIAVAISGSQKTLMVGLSIAIEYFGGLAILPMVAYHIAQLFLDTIIADRWKSSGLK